MSSDLFQTVRDGLQPRLADVLADILPGGRIVGREYCCASLEGGQGNSCRTNLQNGVGSDFATGERWSDIISLAAQCWRLRPGEAARELARRYALSPDCATTSSPAPARPFIPLLPVPPSAPEPPRRHGQLGTYTQLWRYLDEAGRLLACVARFSREDGSKVILPLSYGREGGTGSPGWFWKALPEPRPLYGLHGLALRPEAPVLLVEGEKTADAAQRLFPEYAVLTWSGGANAVCRSAYAPLRFRRVTIWPDNDAPGFRAVCSLLTVLAEQEVTPLCVLPPSELPEAWDLADEVPEHMDIGQCLKQALPAADFLRHAQERFPGLHVMQDAHLRPDEPVELELHSWPTFSWEACPGILGEFVRLATRDSEADPAAVCITALVRFCAEVYGLAPNYGLHIHVGETIHPPRLFAVICGNSSKARKGTSRHPVSRLFGRQFCRPSDLQAWKLPLPARESSGPLSTGEGLAFHVREESDAERERWQAAHPEEVLREKGDKRLLVMDEEFASGLACTRREGNTLSMGIRSFWDSGDYAPLTKNNPITVRGAHINILTHITMQELAVSLGDVQAFNGFGNRFLWICARRAKLVPLPSPMPEEKLAPLQQELWRLIARAQKRGLMRMSERGLTVWKEVYPELSREHIGLVGCLINRAEAQTLRLALVYALLDGQEQIDAGHLQAALAMWSYARASAMYIFGSRGADPLEEKVLAALRRGPMSATELSRVFHGHVPKERLQPVLQQLEAQRRISISREKTGGRSRLILCLCEKSEYREISEKRESGEKRGDAS